MSYGLIVTGIFLFFITFTCAVNANVQEEPWVIVSGYVGAFVIFITGVILYTIRDRNEQSKRRLG